MRILRYFYESWAVWVVIAFIGSFYITHIQLEHSREAYLTDKSALAWTGFLPFIYPIFLAYSVVATLLSMVIYKISYYLVKRHSK